MKIHLDKKITTGKIDSHEILLGKKFIFIPCMTIFLFEKCVIDTSYREFKTRIIILMYNKQSGGNTLIALQ
jgi:hypothetical protein